MSNGNRRAQRRALAMDRVRESAGGVQLLEHAKRRAAELDFHETDVLACIARPETTYGGHPQYGPGQEGLPSWFTSRDLILVRIVGCEGKVPLRLRLCSICQGAMGTR
jgi:hypothetical protein